ncbi:MAG: hypothetical protein ACOC4Z_02425 [Patescibacteria group bacterium]
MDTHNLDNAQEEKESTGSSYLGERSPSRQCRGCRYDRICQLQTKYGGALVT